MFAFYINGGSTDNDCFAQTMEIAFSPVDDAGVEIVGWTEVYVDIFYLSDSTNGMTYLERGAGEYHDVQLTALGTEGANVYGLKESMNADTIAWCIANRGRPLYFLFKNSSNETGLKTKFYTGRVDFDSDMYHTTTDVTQERLEWLKNDIENVVFPRLKRILQYCGENLLLDLFTYDNAGNITGMRIRGFDSTTNASAATIDNTSVESGEDITLTVTQTHDLPRNVRSSHLSVADTDADDATVTAANVTDVTEAPGNTTWPT